MRIRRVLILFTVTFIIQIVGSCCGCAGCEEALTNHYSFKSVAVTHLDNSGAKPIASSGPVLKYAYGVGVTIEREQLAMISDVPRYSFFQSAYACDCVGNEYIPKDTLSTFKIFTVNDFDDTHPAGSDVSDYYRISNLNAYTQLDHYVDMYGFDTLYGPSQLQSTLEILLMTPPTLNTTHQFRIELVLTDGRVMEQMTTPIDLVE